MSDQSGRSTAGWAEAQLWQRGFSIGRKEPSTLLQEAVSRVGEEYIRGAHLLDLGAGRLRNAIYLARLGAKVDAIDEVRPPDLDELTKDLPVSFLQSRVQDFEAAKNIYDGAARIRLLQYIEPEGVRKLTLALSRCIKSAGFLAISYVVEGGIVSHPESPVAVYSHKPELVEDRLQQVGFSVPISRSNMVEPSATVPGIEERTPLTICELIAERA